MNKLSYNLLTKVEKGGHYYSLLRCAIRWAEAKSVYTSTCVW